MRTDREENSALHAPHENIGPTLGSIGVMKAIFFDERLKFVLVYLVKGSFGLRWVKPAKVAVPYAEVISVYLLVRLHLLVEEGDVADER